MRAAYGHKKMINTPKIYKMRIVFRGSEEGTANSNIFNAVRNMVLASGLAFEPAKMNKNWPRLAYGPAPAFGQIAEREYLDIYLTQPVCAAQVQEALQRVKPPYIQLLSVQRVPYTLPSVQSLASVAQYRIEGDFTQYRPEETPEAFFNADRIELVRQAESGLTITVNIKPYVFGVQTLSPRALRLTLTCVEGKWMKPQIALSAWLGMNVPLEDEGFTVEGFTFIREGLFWQDSAGALHLI